MLPGQSRVRRIEDALGLSRRSSFIVAENRHDRNECEDDGGYDNE
jgi:hypothetical protein